MGPLLSFALWAAAVGGPAGGQAPRIDVSARQTSSTGFFTRGASPFSDFFDDGFGRVSMDARQVQGEDGMINRTVRLSAQFRHAGDTYDVEMNLPPAPGLVYFEQEVHGNTGLGSGAMPRVHAVAAAWGTGTVRKNGQVLADGARIEALALDAGAHADDGSHRMMPRARPLDAEIEIVAEGLPTDAEPGGFIDFAFDDVEIDLNGTPVPAVSVVPSEQAVAAAPPANGPGTALYGTGGSGLGLTTAVANTATTPTGVNYAINTNVTAGISPTAGTGTATPAAPATPPTTAESLSTNLVNPALTTSAAATAPTTTTTSIIGGTAPPYYGVTPLSATTTTATAATPATSAGSASTATTPAGTTGASSAAAQTPGAPPTSARATATPASTSTTTPSPGATATTPVSGGTATPAPTAGTSPAAAAAVASGATPSTPVTPAGASPQTSTVNPAGVAVTLTGGATGISAPTQQTPGIPATTIVANNPAIFGTPSAPGIPQATPGIPTTPTVLNNPSATGAPQAQGFGAQQTLGIPSTPLPVNSGAATPLIQGISPLNSQPAGTTTPPALPILPPVQAPTPPLLPGAPGGNSAATGPGPVAPPSR